MKIELVALPDVEGEHRPKRNPGNPGGWFHIALARGRTAQGKLHLYGTIDRCPTGRPSEPQDCHGVPQSPVSPLSPIKFTPFRLAKVIGRLGPAITVYPMVKDKELYDSFKALQVCGAFLGSRSTEPTLTTPAWAR